MACDLTGEELDRRMREILLAATPETVFSSTSALVELGFGPAQAFDMICKIVDVPRVVVLESRALTAEEFDKELDAIINAPPDDEAFT